MRESVLVVVALFYLFLFVSAYNTRDLDLHIFEIYSSHLCPPLEFRETIVCFVLNHSKQFGAIRIENMSSR